MTLLELLVKELPKRGGWPYGAVRAYQSEVDGEVYFFNKNDEYTEENNGDDKWYFVSTTTRGVHNGITREQFEAAIAAQQPVWDGKGFPPVGEECEIQFINDTPPKEWFSFKLIGIHEDIIIMNLDGERVWKHKSKLSSERVIFRHIRTEAEGKREETINALISLGVFTRPVAVKTIDAIAAGKIPGVELTK